MANEAKMVFASATTVISLTAALTDGNVGGGSALLDNSTNLYPMATATLQVPDSFSAAPTDRSRVALLMVRQDSVDGTVDDTAAPTGTDIEAAELVGEFIIHDTDEAQTMTINISLLGVHKAYFYIKNSTGVSLSYTSNAITVKVRPFSLVPA